MLDLPLLGSVYPFSLLPFQKHRLDLLIQEFLGPGVPGIQSVMVDEESLMLQPLCPTVLADLVMNPLSQGIPERGLGQSGGVHFATTALDRIH